MVLVHIEYECIQSPIHAITHAHRQSFMGVLYMACKLEIVRSIFKSIYFNDYHLKYFQLKFIITYETIFSSILLIGISIRNIFNLIMIELLISTFLCKYNNIITTRELYIWLVK